MPHVALLVRLLQLATQDRTQLVLENIALRHQLAVYKRTVVPPETPSEAPQAHHAGF